MLKRTFLFIGLSIAIVACNKVDNPYPENPAAQSGDLDQSLYPGDWQDYLDNEWPVFSENANTNRNLLIEDFTGHQCKFCPAAAKVAHEIEEDHPGRVFVSTIHSGPDGAGIFQETKKETEDNADFSYDFTNEIGLTIGITFGSEGNGGFDANPKGTVSRTLSNGIYTYSESEWSSIANGLIAANDLKVNLQALVNFYDQTNGGFIHVEIDTMDSDVSAEDLGIVVAFYHDSIVKPQLFPAFPVNPDYHHSADTNYVHRDLLKAHINGSFKGASLSANNRDEENNKYYLDYSFKLGEGDMDYPATDSHFLVYAMDKETWEIYQVIKVKLKN